MNNTFEIDDQVRQIFNRQDGKTMYSRLRNAFSQSDSMRYVFNEELNLYDYTEKTDYYQQVSNFFLCASDWSNVHRKASSAMTLQQLLSIIRLQK